MNLGIILKNRIRINKTLKITHKYNNNYNNYKKLKITFCNFLKLCINFLICQIILTLKYILVNL